MAGIYIHIPFCKKACHYCNFHFSTGVKYKRDFLEALFIESGLRKEYLGSEKVNTIYFGGGTPSLLSTEEIIRIIDMLYTYFKIDNRAEITLEANPDDLTANGSASFGSAQDESLTTNGGGYLDLLRNTPVNRLSIGVQSFIDNDLKFMNRSHTALQAMQAIKSSQDKGFENISVDLIYGIPGLSLQNWESNINKLMEMKIPHISAYCLTVEEKTPLHTFIRKGLVPDIDQDEGALQYEALMRIMEQNNYLHYEISNFSKKGFISRHNSNYWRGEHYLGLGPSAHSFNGFSRQWNIANNQFYIKGLKAGELNFEIEQRDSRCRYNEYVLTSLRTIWGTDISVLKQDFEPDFASHFEKAAAKHLGTLLMCENSVYSLTAKGKLLADRITTDLLMD